MILDQSFNKENSMNIPMTRIDQHKFGPWAIVTGASSGIGKEFARQLAASGLNLILVARRLSLLEELGHQLASQFGVQYRAVGLDLMTDDFLEVLEDATQDLDVGLVVSNAGTGHPGAFLTIDRNRLRAIVQLNVIAALDLTHHFGQKLVKRGRGGVLLVSAVAAVQGLPYMANDSATKAYVHNLGEALHVEFEQAGVNMTVLVPVLVETPVLAKLGLEADALPMKPISIEQCVAEALDALNANRATTISRALMAQMMEGMSDTLIKKLQSRASIDPIHAGI
jgi:short-subunit dehydrogenase